MLDYLKIFACLVAIAVFAEGAFDFDRYQEQSAASQNAEHCCVECCPAHHLAPIVQLSVRWLAPSGQRGFVTAIFMPALPEPVHAIFHPPKSA